MSIYKTRISNLSVQLLQQAITSFAKQIGATITQNVKDAYGNSQQVTIGLAMRSLPYGIGFGVDAQGNLTIYGDSYDHEDEWNRISNLAQNYVKANIVAVNARNAHPQAQIRPVVKEREVLLEVSF